MRNTTELGWVFIFIGMGMLTTTYAESLPDPTRPADYVIRTVIEEDLPRELIDWRVTAISTSSGVATAIVNNKLVRVGDTIGRAKVIEITARTVVLDYDRKQVVVRLWNEIDKKVVKNQQPN